MAIARGENVTFGSINVNDCVLPIAEGTPNKTYLNWYAFVGGLTVVFVTIRGLVSASVVAPSIRVWMHCSWSWSIVVSSVFPRCTNHVVHHSCMIALFLVLVIVFPLFLPLCFLFTTVMLSCCMVDETDSHVINTCCTGDRCQPSAREQKHSPSAHSIDHESTDEFL